MTVVEELLNYILRKSYHHGQSGSCFVVYNVTKQLMLDLLLKDVNDETLETFIERFFDTDAAANWPLKKLLTSIPL